MENEKWHANTADELRALMQTHGFASGKLVSAPASVIKEVLSVAPLPSEGKAKPSEAQLKRFADVIAEAGINTREPFDVVLVMKLILLAISNKDRILGYDRL